GYDACQFHDQCRSRAVIVGRLSPSVAIHMGTDDVHFIRVRCSDLRAIDLFAPTWLSGLGIQRTPLRIRLQRGIDIDAGMSPCAAVASAAGCGICALCNGRSARALRVGGEIGVLDARGVRTSVALQLRLDPIHCGAISVRSLAAVAELRETLDGRLVSLQVEALNKSSDRIRLHRRGLAGCGHRCRRYGCQYDDKRYRRCISEHNPSY